MEMDTEDTRIGFEDHLIETYVPSTEAATKIISNCVLVYLAKVEYDKFWLGFFLVGMLPFAIVSQRDKQRKWGKK